MSKNQKNPLRTHKHENPKKHKIGNHSIQAKYQYQKKKFPNKTRFTKITLRSFCVDHLLLVMRPTKQNKKIMHVYAHADKHTHRDTHLCVDQLSWAWDLY